MNIEFVNHASLLLEENGSFFLLILGTFHLLLAAGFKPPHLT